MTDLVLLEVRDGVATLTLNRPDKRNAMSDDMRTQFIAALESVAADKAIRALVLTGAGKGFCAGGDIAGMERRMQAPAGEIAFNGWHRQQRVHHTQALLHTHAEADHRRGQRRRRRDWAPTPRWRATSSSRASGRTSPGRTSTAGSFPTAAACTSCRAGSDLPKAKELIFTGRKVDVDEAIALGIADRKTQRRDAARGRAGLGARAEPGLGHGACARQDDPQPELRGFGRADLQSRAARRKASATRAPSTASP